MWSSVAGAVVDWQRHRPETETLEGVPGCQGTPERGRRCCVTLRACRRPGCAHSRPGGTRIWAGGHKGGARRRAATRPGRGSVCTRRGSRCTGRCAATRKWLRTQGALRTWRGDASQRAAGGMEGLAHGEEAGRQDCEGWPFRADTFSSLGRAPLLADLATGARGACCRRCWRRLRRTARWAEPQRMLWARRARRRSYLWWTRHCSRRAVGRRSRRRRTSGHASAAAGRLPAARMWRVAPRKVRREACACQQPCASSVRVAS